MKQLGTILPTPESERLSARIAAREATARKAAETRLLGGRGYSRQIIGGETRFYDGANRYAIISSRTLRPLWFTRRDDGWYAE